MTDIQEASTSMNAVKDLTAGYASGFCGKLVEYPFDTVKVLQQTQGSRYGGALECLKLTVQEHGFLGLYRGLATPLIGAMAENATLFASYGLMKRAIGVDKMKDDEIPLWKLSLCGAGSGVAVSFVLTPVELIKCKLQAQQGSDAAFRQAVKQYSGPIECIQDTWRTQGVRGFFRGNVSTLAREIPGNVAWFGVYEGMCKLQMGPGQTKSDLSFASLMLSGAASGVAYWSAFFPADTVKSKQQTDPRYANMNLVEAFRGIHRAEGVRGLYAGWGITAARAAPSHALIFAVYETVSGWLK